MLVVSAGGQTLGAFEVASSFADYEVLLPAGTSITDVQVAFTNDAFGPGFDRNLIVDYVELAGVRFETEAAATTSTGTWNAATGCAPSSLTRSQALNCNGHFVYGN